MSRTSLAQRNDLRMAKSNVSSGVHIGQQLSSKRMMANFPIETHINVLDQLNHLHILDKYNKFTYAENNPHTRNQVKEAGFKGQIYNGKKEGFGMYTFKNGDDYIGYWDNDKMHGMGVYRYGSGNGTLQSSISSPMGSGISYQDRFIYVGEFSEGSFNGVGKIIQLKNDREGWVVYQGYWQRGEKSGYGVYFYSTDTSTYYEGYWQNDMKNGEGKLLFKNGEYSGYWHNDLKQGQGKLRVDHPERSLIYEGEWMNDEIHSGEILYLSGQDFNKEGLYRGQIRNGKKHGQGLFEFRNTFLKGSFENDQFVGQGRIYNDNYDIEGNLLSSKSSLKGKIKYLNGDVFEGIVDLTSGTIKRKQGTYKFSNGDVTEGVFDDQGKGLLIGVFDYLWNNGDKKRFDN